MGALQVVFVVETVEVVGAVIEVLLGVIGKGSCDEALHFHGFKSITYTISLSCGYYYFRPISFEPKEKLIQAIPLQ